MQFDIFIVDPLFIEILN